MRLVLKVSQDVLREFDLDKDAVSIGRKSDNDVVIEHPAVSARHCRILRDGEGWRIEDLGSTNGTTVNGRRVERAVLTDGDLIGVAKHVLVFAEGPAKAPVGGLRVLRGPDAGKEHLLAEASTYIGDSDRAHIRVRGSLLARVPEVAASLHRRAEGYVLVAVADGYPVLNGEAVKGQTPIKDGDVLECGPVALQFFLKK